MISTTRCLITGLLLAFALSACASFAASLRQYTYPPDFKYIPRYEIRSTMWQLASEVRELDKALREPGIIDEERHALISRLLNSMDQTTVRLNGSGRTSNHPLLDQNLPAFRRDIALARQGVERGNYVLVGFLPGACVYCHGAAD
jgi:hypothetical protein